MAVSTVSSPSPTRRGRAPRMVAKRGRRRSKHADNENRSKSKDDDTSFLSMYFREMAALDVLQPEQEFHTARRIEELETCVWERLFAYSAATDYIAKFVEARLETPIPEFKNLRRAATRVRNAGNKKTQDALTRAAQTTARAVHAADRDRLVLEELLAHLRSLTRMGAGRGGTHKLPFSTKTKVFARYLADVESADNAAARARNDFVRANLRLVVSIARRFNHGRMSLADLIQEGNIGLMKAVERYDYSKGFRFSTYASWWIRHAISRALADKGREVRLPVHMIDAYHRLTKATRLLTSRLGRKPTTEELSEETEIPAHKIDKMRTYLVDQSVSLDKPVNDDDGRSFGEFLQDPRSTEIEPADRMANDAMTREVLGLMRELKPIEADILRRRFGLDNDEELTLKQIGKRYNLSRERIRQLQEQALTKMRRALARKEMIDIA